MDHAGTEYQSYLLRLWREGEAGSWRAVLVLTETGARQTFASLESLFTFLTHQVQPDAGETQTRNG